MATIITNYNIKILVRDYIKDKPSLPADLRDIPIGAWDVSNVTKMKLLFNDYRNFNEDISDWDVRNVRSMASMFSSCKAFNQDLSRWNVSKVENMEFMFEQCRSFNQDLSGWNVSKVKNMRYMFFNCTVFNQDLSRWFAPTVENKIENMLHMFSLCYAFNQDLSTWDVSNVTNMGSMFWLCKNFNKPLDNWNVGKVENMKDIFKGCEKLLQNFSRWNVRTVGCDIGYGVLDMFQGTEIVRQRRYDLLPARLIHTIPHYSDSEDYYSDSDSDDYYSDSDDYDGYPPPPRPPRDEIEARRRQAELKASQAVIQSNVTKRAREEVQETSEFPECFCGDLLNNIDGPGPSSHCRENCNDAIKVCGSGHIFHRGCILESCNAVVDIVPGYSKNQERRLKCPVCQKPLTGVNPRIGCNALKNIPAETEEALKEYKSPTGGKKRRHKGKFRKTRYILTKKRKNKGKYRKTRRNKK